jgi:hypothetical protein
VEKSAKPSGVLESASTQGENHDLTVQEMFDADMGTEAAVPHELRFHPQSEGEREKGVVGSE